MCEQISFVICHIVPSEQIVRNSIRHVFAQHYGLRNGNGLYRHRIVTRPYRGREDHPAMASILGDYHRHGGSSDLPTAEQFDVTYANLTNCDTATDIMVIESGGEPVGYVRTSWEQLDNDDRDYSSSRRRDRITFVGHCSRRSSPPKKLTCAPWPLACRPPAFGHTRRIPDQAWNRRMSQPGWSLSDTKPVRFEASLVRPDLEDIPDLPLPDGVEVRAVTPEMLRPIFEAHRENFRGNWDFQEAEEEDFQRFLDDPFRDETMWKIAWVGDTVVGQVKSYINPQENAEMGYLRGYTEYISTHAEWRNRGIAGALLAASLREIKARGNDRGGVGCRHFESGRGVPAVHQVGIRTDRLRSGIRQAVDVK